MIDFLHDPTAWVLISFVIFVVGAFLFGRHTVTAKLDGRIAEIRKEIATAETLKTEAQAMLAEYEAKQRDAMQEADKLVSQAKAQALELQKKAEEDFSTTISRKEASMKERIQRMEETALDDIRRYAAELAISATTQIIAQKMDEKSAQKLADASIQKVAENLN